MIKPPPQQDQEIMLMNQGKIIFLEINQENYIFLINDILTKTGLLFVGFDLLERKNHRN